MQTSSGTMDVCKSSDNFRSRIARLHVDLLADEHGGSIYANARLISAAPDLLAALQELVLAPNKIRPDKYWDDARLAISKATGGDL